MTSVKDKKKQVKSSTVSMSRMDYEIAILVYKRFTAIGLSDEEVSFLMGKRNKYVFDLLNPTEKDKFKTEHLDVLPTILQSKIRDIIPNGIKPNETVKLNAIKKTSDSKTVYEYKVIYADNTESETIRITKKTTKGERKKVDLQVHQLTLQLIEDGYFLAARNALELYLLYKSRIKTLFSPSDLQKSLAICLHSRKNQGALLIKKTVEARYVYKELK